MVCEKNVRLGPIDVACIGWSAPRSEAAHAHEQTRIVVVLSGAFQERRSGMTYDHRPGSVLVRNAHVIHSDVYGHEGGVYVSIVLHDHALAASLHTPTWHPAGIPSVTRLAANLGAEIRRADEWSALASHGLALELLAAVGRHEGVERDHPQWLRDVCAALREDWRRQWTLAEVGRLVDVDPVRLSRTFRRCTGKSIGAYVRELRVDEARRLIESGRTPLSAIAAEVGFCDQSHLNRVFRRVVGASPGRHRRELTSASLRPKASHSS